ncbi:hypothetical protein BGZ47_009496 [Haplosporangium gracile]|nr:hypothetical protein BGZ47_009496 [Haplosporangium gracile]
MVRQTSNTPSLTACTPPKETLPIALTASIPINIPDPEGAEEILKTHQQPFRKNIWNGRMDRFNKSRSTTLSPEEVIPTAQGSASARTGLLAAMGTNVSRASLTKVKDPAVMRDLMVLARERRASRTLCDGVSEDGMFGIQPISCGGNQFRGRSRMTMKQFEHRNDNDNDTPTTTITFTTNHDNAKSNSLSISAPSRKITLEDKKAFLKTQEMRRRSNQRRSQSLNTVDASSTSVSPYYPFSTSPSLAQDSLSIDTHPGFSWKDRSQQGRTATSPIPAMSVTIPLKRVQKRYRYHSQIGYSKPDPLPHAQEEELLLR